MLKDSLTLYYFLDNNAAATTPSLDEKKTTVCDIHAEKKCSQVQTIEDKNQQPPLAEEEPRIQRDLDLKTDTPTKGSSEISQDSSLVFSSDRSSVTDDDSSKVEEEKHLEATGKDGFNEINQDKLEDCSLPSLYHNLLSKKASHKDDLNKTNSPDSSSSTISSSASNAFTALSPVALSFAHKSTISSQLGITLNRNHLVSSCDLKKK